MTGRRKRDDEYDDITAQPMAPPDELGHRVGHEVGLSVDAEDLGRNFLSDATEQGNFESEYDASVELSAGPPSDEALSGPNFEERNDVWESTINLTLQGAEDDEPLFDEHADGMRLLDDDEQTSGNELDLTENALHEASLLDSEDEETGEVESPRVRAEDTHTHGRPRGGHSARSRTKSAAGPR